ncbi:MAG: 2-oxo acid dehydrogenase subunit E2, partial [Planctomycetes bacterium]|nr:2-oxo acid dehydrogenase subunit E2 [Planctomycetota bacterium]
PAPAPPPLPRPAAPAPVATVAAKVPRTANGRFYSPLVRSIAEAHGVSEPELAAIAGSGAQGRVTKDDVLAYLAKRPGGAVAPARPAADQIVPMDRMRGLIAQHMVHSIHTSAHVFIMTEADMTGIVEFRERAKGPFEERTGEKLTFTPFFLKASALALRDFPYVNAQVNPEAAQITLKADVNVGMAVAVPHADGTYGLIVPVIRNADSLPLTEIARQANDLARRGREGKLKPDEPQGGTFTVTNMGVFGSYGGLPIINQPQVAILGVGAIEKRPAVIDDRIVIRHKVFLSVGIDHRLVDGALGGQFLERIRHYLEKFETWILF